MTSILPGNQVASGDVSPRHNAVETDVMQTFTASGITCYLFGPNATHVNTPRMLQFEGMIPIQLSRTEYQIIHMLLTIWPGYVSFQQLLSEMNPDIENLSAADRNSLAQHIKRIRGKLLGFGVDISCVLNKGYILTTDM